jgi:hypothetical protein
VHGHLRKKGSKRDKPKGSIIKCYPGTKVGLQKARAMHYAIIKSKK